MKHPCECGCEGECKCHSPHCVSRLIERPRYFPGLVMTPEELILEHNYLRDKMRRHNIYLHGWGVVCGAHVDFARQHDGSVEKFPPYKVRVNPGYILGPYGDEIVIESPIDIDLRTCGCARYCGEEEAVEHDPFCGSERRCREKCVLYIAVKYAERHARPVRTYCGGCDCDSTRCESSRWRDGYEIGILDEPCRELEWQGREERRPNPFEWMCGCKPCPPECPPSPWVYLAAVIVGEEGEIQRIDNCICRRHVVTIPPQYCQCKPERVVVEGIGDSEDKRGEEYSLHPGTRSDLYIFGKNLQVDAEIFAGDISVTIERDSKPSELHVSVVVPERAAPGHRYVFIRSCEISVAVPRNIHFNVMPAPKTSSKLGKK